MRSELLSSLLKDVSRSFYLTMRILPARIRPQIGTAYLLARTTDTIADTGVISIESRLAALQRLRENILGRSTAS
jgi:farnesyl-diphosphate farnesyltransferase